MLVYKFGGASIADANRMKALLPIIREAQEPLLIVVSALGKTTNMLEHIVNQACLGEMDEAMAQVQHLKQQHLDYALALLDEENYAHEAFDLNNYFIVLENAVKKADATNYDYSYDQVVSMGELLSSGLLYCLLHQQRIPSAYIDIRTVIRTDDTYRDAVVDWNFSAAKAKEIIAPQLQQGKIVVTQGFIGATADNHSVTLGREGSDYTAAILAAMLSAKSVTIWKDVEGLQNADPKQFPDTVKIDAISYNEVIEMAFYGAQIIHPKTIKPLQNNDIPLYVKCFLNSKLSGTVIQSEVNNITYPPLIVLKENQVLMQVTTRDFSFITEDNISKLYSIFHTLKIKVNLIQNAAISFVACIDNREDKVKELIQALGADYKVTVNEKVSLLTIRHYTPGIVAKLTADKQVLLTQETRKTVQVIMK